MYAHLVYTIVQIITAKTRHQKTSAVIVLSFIDVGKTVKDPLSIRRKGAEKMKDDQNGLFRNLNHNLHVPAYAHAPAPACTLDRRCQNEQRKDEKNRHK